MCLLRGEGGLVCSPSLLLGGSPLISKEPQSHKRVGLRADLEATTV